jgi:hypothetical protein
MCEVCADATSVDAAAAARVRDRFENRFFDFVARQLDPSCGDPDGGTVKNTCRRIYSCNRTVAATFLVDGCSVDSAQPCLQGPPVTRLAGMRPIRKSTLPSQRVLVTVA